MRPPTPREPAWPSFPCRRPALPASRCWTRRACSAPWWKATRLCTWGRRWIGRLPAGTSGDWRTSSVPSPSTPWSWWEPGRWVGPSCLPPLPRTWRGCGFQRARSPAPARRWPFRCGCCCSRRGRRWTRVSQASGWRRRWCLWTWPSRRARPSSLPPGRWRRRFPWSFWWGGRDATGAGWRLFPRGPREGLPRAGRRCRWR